MDQIFGKVGSYWAGQTVKSELNSVSTDVNAMGSSIENGTKWMFDKFKGTMQKPLAELLKEYDLPCGLFPKEANYEFDEHIKRLEVTIPNICEVGYRDSSILRFSTTVSGYLEKGKFTNIEGLKTKVMIWVKVSTIVSEGSKIHLSAGLKKTRDRDAYEHVKDGVVVDKF